MSIRTLAFTVVILGFSAAVYAQDMPVAITNPGFEGAYLPVAQGGPVTGVTANGWDHNSGYGDTTTVYSRDTRAPHGGAACQSITVSAVRGGNLQLLQGLQFQQGSIYTLGVWLRGVPGSVVDVTLQGGGPQYQQLDNVSLAVTADWQFVTAQGYVTQDSPGAVIISLNAPGTICVDDITVSRRAGTLAPSPVVGPVPANFFGIHVANFQIGRLRNSHFYLPLQTVGLPGAAISGAIAHDWEVNSSWADVDIYYRGDATPVPGGGKAQAIEVRAVRSGRQQLRQQIAVRPGGNYIFSAAVRAALGTTVQMLIQNTLAPYDSYASRDIVGDGAWHDYAVTGPVGETGLISLMFASGEPGSYAVGNVRLTTAGGQGAPSGITFPTEPFGTLRLWDSGTTWALLEPVPGIWSFDQLDRWIAAAKPGQDIILTLGQSPTWASSDPLRFSYYGAGASAPPKQMSDWSSYVQKVAQPYRGKIKYYEVWNEPNDSTFYSGTIAQLADLTRATAAALREADPGALLITAPAYSAGYLDRYLATGAAQDAAIIGYHVYATPPEEASRQLANVNLVLAKWGVIKPLWDTEGGSGDATTPGDIAATYMARKYLTDLAFGARNFGWYGWGPSTPYAVGTVEGPRRTQTPAAKAYGVVHGWLTGASVDAASIDSAQNWSIALILASGAKALIVWNPTHTEPFTVPSGFASATATTLSNVVTPVQGGMINATFSPVLIVARSS